MAVAQRGGSADRRCAAGQHEPGEGPEGIPDPAGKPVPAGKPDGETRQQTAVARRIRAQNLVSGRTPAEIAAIIRDQCGPEFGTTSIRGYRLAFGVALADVVAQVRARYAAEGRALPRFSETLLSAYDALIKAPAPRTR